MLLSSLVRSAWVRSVAFYSAGVALVVALCLLAGGALGGCYTAYETRKTVEIAPHGIIVQINGASVPCSTTSPGSEAETGASEVNGNSYAFPPVVLDFWLTDDGTQRIRGEGSGTATITPEVIPE